MSDGVYEQQLLDDTRDEITRADTKASILFSLVGVVVGAVIYAFLRGQWTPFRLANSIEWIWWLGAGAVVAALVLLGRAVYPIVEHDGQQDRLTYFGHVVQFEDRSDYLDAMRNRRDSSADRMRDQIWVLSHVVSDKYRFTRWAMLSFAGGSLMMLAAVGLHEVIA